MPIYNKVEADNKFYSESWYYKLPADNKFHPVQNVFYKADDNKWHPVWSYEWVNLKCTRNDGLIMNDICCDHLPPH